jgi:hypothetical protein
MRWLDWHDGGAQRASVRKRVRCRCGCDVDEGIGPVGAEEQGDSNGMGLKPSFPLLREEGGHAARWESRCQGRCSHRAVIRMLAVESRQRIVCQDDVGTKTPNFCGELSTQVERIEHFTIRETQERHTLHTEFLGGSELFLLANGDEGTRISPVLWYSLVTRRHDDIVDDRPGSDPAGDGPGTIEFRIIGVGTDHQDALRCRRCPDMAQLEIGHLSVLLSWNCLVAWPVASDRRSLWPDQRVRVGSLRNRLPRW